MLARFLVLATLLASSLTLFSADPPKKRDKKKSPPALNDPESARRAMTVPNGMQLDLWASEPHLANPVVFCIDNKGRLYVAETFRLHKGVPDIRGIMSWLNDDLSSRTVEDRVAMMRRRLGTKFADTDKHSERIRLLEDTTGIGKADKSTVFAEGFGRPQDGLAAGLLARGNEVWYTCIPDLWLLRDSKGQGKADERKVLHTGYGIHIGFIGHDLHGLTLGPDGKLYFSIGDRGLNVKSGGKHFFYPDTGSVLRCNLDGSDLEVFATGLRNPQELAFDKYGNLFTGDNNSDGGDRARWVYLVEGGDCGWRIGYQFGGSMSNRGPWNAEKLWHPPHEGQPAWIIPPITNLGDGPSGLTYNPGVGLPARYDDHFFLADFRGAANSSGIRSFAVKPKGAGFELTDSHQFLWGVLATDVDFGPDGAFYVSDWVHGWGLTGKGRIWKLTSPEAKNDPRVKEAKALLAEGFAKKATKDLAKLLEHADRRVRLEAQLALAGHSDAVTTFAAVLKSSKSQLARLHALWGLGIAGRKSPAAFTEAKAALADGDAEVRGQAAKVLGEGRVKAAVKALAKLLHDESPRARFFAAMALGKIGADEVSAAVVAMLNENADRDLYLRHAGVVALASCGEARLRDVSRDPSVAVRRAALLAYRRLESPAITSFLNDTETDLVAEAARAINDVPIALAMPALAALSERRGLSESVGYRVLNAHYRSGKAEDARAVAGFAARPGERESLRIEAVRMLGEWDKPGVRDRVMGVARPLPARPSGLGAEALRVSLGGIFAGPDKLRQEAAKVAANLGIKEIGPALYALVIDAKNPPEVRVETLRALAAIKDARLGKAVQLGLASDQPALRAEARRYLVRLTPTEGYTALQRALDEGTTVEKQRAFDVLGETPGEKSQKLLGTWLDRLLANKVDSDVRLDLIEAVERHGAAALKAQLARYEKTAPGPLGKWRDSLMGGDAEAGRRIFLHKTEVACLRCHRAGSEGTGEVGPNLTGIGAKQNREYLLQSVVDPNKQIAKGYETVDVILVTGQTRSGIFRSEDAKGLRLMTPEGVVITVPRDQIEERRSGRSSMPEDLIKHLSRREVRDLVAFLASLKEVAKK